MLLTIYVVIASIGCSPLAVATHEGLNVIGVDSQIAVATVAGRMTYCHIFVIIDGKAYEPRYLGMYHQSNIDYDHPYFMYASTEEYLNAGYSLFPSSRSIAVAIEETLGMT
jgi:hypothetical protein